MGGIFALRPERAPTPRSQAPGAAVGQTPAPSRAPQVLDLSGNAPLIEAMAPFDLSTGMPTDAIPYFSDYDPKKVGHEAIADTFDDGVTRPTVSGSMWEGLTRGTEAYLRAKAHHDERDEEASDRDEAKRREFEQRQAYADAVGAANSHPNDPAAAEAAVSRALAAGDPAAAFQHADSNLQRQLSHADAIDTVRETAPIQANADLLGRGYRDDGHGGYSRFGPAQDAFDAHREEMAIEHERNAVTRDNQSRGEMRQAGAMRGQFMQAEQDFRSIRDAYSTIHGLIGRQAGLTRNGQAPSAMTDVAIVFQYMKMLDPSSVVREGEYATASNAGGVPTQVQNMYNRAINGSFLSNDQRAQMAEAAGGIYQTREAQFKRDRATWTDMATHSGYDPDVVAPDLTLPDLASAMDDSPSPSPAGGQAQTYSQLPPAAQHNGEVMMDDQGRAVRSVGGRWIPVAENEMTPAQRRERILQEQPLAAGGG